MLLSQNAEEEAHAPFDFPAVFAGNFGELRSDHFHAGLDFKTQGATGKQVHSLYDGYISRVSYGSGGLSLTVVCDTGITTVFRHLSSFLPELDAKVREEQYLKEAFGVSLTFEKDAYRVHKGQVIALSGNTGYSFGPHLHLEFLDTQSGDYLDPLPYLRNVANDHQQPRAVSFLVEPVMEQGVVEGKASRRIYPISYSAPIKVWGRVGLAVKAYDYMDGAPNQCGVCFLRMEVDGKEVFSSHVDRFNSREDLYINSWVREGHMRTWAEPGNHLSMLSFDDSRGVLDISEERTYHIRLIMEDAYGNRSEKTVLLQGRRQDIPATLTLPRLEKDRTMYMSLPGMELLVPRGSLYDDVPLVMKAQYPAGGASLVYTLTDSSVPLHHAATISIKPLKDGLTDADGIYMTRVDAKGNPQGNVGAEYDALQGLWRAKVTRLGRFALMRDTVAPTVEWVNQQAWNKTGRILFKVSDELSGVGDFRLEVDGKFVPSGKENALSSYQIGRLDRSRLQKGDSHTLVLKVWDAVGNVCEEKMEFTYKN